MFIIEAFLYITAFGLSQGVVDCIRSNLKGHQAYSNLFNEAQETHLKPDCCMGQRALGGVGGHTGSYALPWGGTAGTSDMFIAYGTLENNG